MAIELCIIHDLCTLVGWLGARPRRLEVCDGEAVQAPADGRRDPLNQSESLSAVPAAALTVCRPVFAYGGLQAHSFV
jgi:hypothetical protein